MHEWMNKKLKTNRKEIEQQMQKKLEYNFLLGIHIQTFWSNE